MISEMPLLTALITGKLAHGVNAAGAQGPEVMLHTAYGDDSQPQMGPFVTLSNTKTNNTGIWPFNKLNILAGSTPVFTVASAGFKIDSDLKKAGCSAGE